MGALGCQATSQIANPGEKIRYAAEFFDELFPGKKVVKRQKKFTSALKQLQDGLGDLNDIAVDERLIASVAPHNDAFATGLHSSEERMTPPLYEPVCLLRSSQARIVTLPPAPDHYPLKKEQ
jgi:hypothetical protein